MNRRAIGIVMLGIVLLGTIGWTKEPLTPKEVFAYEPISDFWKKEYEAIKGNSMEEKSENALTTVQMEAIMAMELFKKQKELAEIGLKLWESLPEELYDMRDRPRDRFLETHQTWKAYTWNQAKFIANTTGGGTIHPLIFAQTLVDEIEWRIQLYQDLLDGKNATKDDLYFYSCKPERSQDQTDYCSNTNGEGFQVCQNSGMKK